MLSAKSALSIKKRDLLNQKTPAVGFQPLYFGHKATAGDTGINLASLVTPSVEMPSLVQPSQAQLLGANLLFFNKNLILTSSARGMLVNKMDYEVVSNTQINFIGFTALANEVFTGILSDAVSTGSRIVSTAVAPVTGTLAAGVTSFPVGTPFRAGAFSSSQVGEVMVFLDGVQQYRNTGNSSSTLDGNYYEYDPGSGMSNEIRFNTPDLINARSVTVIYTNAVAERPDGSMMAVIESAQGQVNKLIEVVSDVSGLPESTFRVAPSNVDLKTFGDKVVTLQNLETTPGSGLPKLATATVDGAVKKPNGMVRSDTGSGHGSSSTKIRWFTNNNISAGTTSISVTSNSTVGTVYTINEDGIYSMTYTDRYSAGVTYIGISLNATSFLTTSIDSVPAANRLAQLAAVGTTGGRYSVSATVRLSAGDTIRAHDDGNTNDGGDGPQFSITQIARL